MAANSAARGVRRPATNETANAARARAVSVFGLTAKCPEGSMCNEAATPIRSISIPHPGTPAGNIEKNLCTARKGSPRCPAAVPKVRVCKSLPFGGFSDLRNLGGCAMALRLEDQQDRDDSSQGVGAYWS